jgi:hypothetical protein
MGRRAVCLALAPGTGSRRNPGRETDEAKPAGALPSHPARGRLKHF